MKRGYRLYQCGECEAKTRLHWVELNRAGRPRCSACGSANLSPVTKEAKDELLIGNTNVLRSREQPKGGLAPVHKLQDDVIRAQTRTRKNG